MSDPSDIAGGDARRTNALRDCLDELAGSDNELLREMARTVLDGVMTLREVAASQVYGAELARPFSTFWSDYQLTAEERAALEDDSRS